MIYYKVLRDGEACHGGDFDCTPYFPKGSLPGDWTPEIESPSVCRSGYHATDADHLHMWLKSGNQVWVVEFRNRPMDAGGKIVGSQMRFIRQVGHGEKIGDVLIVTKGHADVSGGYVLASGNSIVRAFGSSIVTAYDRSTVKAFNRSTVDAYGSSTVEAYERSTVKASGSSTVKAFNRSTVKAYDRSTVTASGSSIVDAYDCSSVRAYGSSIVTAYDRSTVTALGSPTVEAYDRSTVKASGSSTVKAFGSSTVKAYDRSMVFKCRGGAKVTCADGAVLIDRY